MVRLTTLSWLVFAASLMASHASAQIRNPGQHTRYVAELEPHLVLQWSQEPAWDDDGVGLGGRATFPVIESGPVTTINNSLGVGVGLDWAHFDDPCNFGINRTGDDCSADDFWLPVVVQWNFYFSELISAFPELGLGIQHTRWDNTYCRVGNNWAVCGGDESDTDVELVLWLGVRFHLAERFALTLRLGVPSLLLGASFFL